MSIHLILRSRGRRRCWACTSSPQLVPDNAIEEILDSSGPSSFANSWTRVDNGDSSCNGRRPKLAGPARPVLWFSSTGRAKPRFLRRLCRTGWGRGRSLRRCRRWSGTDPAGTRPLARVGASWVAHVQITPLGLPRMVLAPGSWFLVATWPGGSGDEPGSSRGTGRGPEWFGPWPASFATSSSGEGPAFDGIGLRDPGMVLALQVGVARGRGDLMAVGVEVTSLGASDRQGQVRGTRRSLTGPGPEWSGSSAPSGRRESSSARMIVSIG